MGRVKHEKSRRKRCVGASAERIDKAQEKFKGKDSFLGSKAHPGNGRGVESAGPWHRRLLRKGVARAGGAEIARDRRARNQRV